MNNEASQGFTLIEVLIALVIISIALTAIIKSTAQSIRDTSYIQNKTIAAWVGTEIINEARAGIIKLPVAPDKLEQETEMLGQKWEWQASMQTTPNPHIKKIMVAVKQKTTQMQLINFTSYLYVAKENAN